jgi:hypothetical protein
MALETDSGKRRYPHCGTVLQQFLSRHGIRMKAPDTPPFSIRARPPGESDQPGAVVEAGRGAGGNGTPDNTAAR